MTNNNNVRITLEFLFFFLYRSLFTSLFSALCTLVLTYIKANQVWQSADKKEKAITIIALHISFYFIYFYLNLRFCIDSRKNSTRKYFVYNNFKFSIPFFPFCLQTKRFSSCFTSNVNWKKIPWNEKFQSAYFLISK